jgi:ribosome maturation factor RimP
LEEITLSNGSPKILTVIVDSDSHLNLDQVTILTKEISAILDTLPELGDLPFTLEVTSPGIERPLTLARHWNKNHGRLVTGQLQDGSTFSGRIGALSGDLIAIDQREIPLSDIKRATIEIEFKSGSTGASK